MGRVGPPSSAAGTISHRACFTIGKGNTSRGKFDNEPTQEAALKDRVEQLERLVGKLTLENEFLKKGLQNSLSQSRKNGKSSRYTDTSPEVFGGDAK